MLNDFVEIYRRNIAYDYTKDPSVLAGDGWVLPNYRKVYSWNEGSDPELVAEFLMRGGTTAFVTNRVKGAPVAAHVLIDGLPFLLVDGDVSDDRFNDPSRCVVDLYAKGKARNRRSAFVQRIY